MQSQHALLDIKKLSYVGIDYADICLTRGAKRKLTQSSLLNFRFSKKVAVEPISKSLDNEFETKSTNQSNEDSSSDQAFFSLDSEPGNSKASSSVSSTVFLDGSVDICDTFNVVAPPNIVLANLNDSANDGSIEHCSSNLLQTVATSTSIESCTNTNSISTLTVDTVIVGRKFHENIELQEGAGITVERDPQNAKDHDAIKVSIFSR